MMSRDEMSTLVVYADAVYRRNGVDAMGTQRVKGTIDIPNDMMLRDHGLLSRVLEVLVRQWGLHGRGTHRREQRRGGRRDRFQQAVPS